MSNPAPSPVADAPTVDGFLRTVLASGLLSTDQVQQALQAIPSDRLRDPGFIADHLVKVGKLSRFQANKLIQGITRGLVLGPYHLLAPIGKGGMGAVYLARNSRTQQLVAVKVLPPKKAKAEERLIARFRREMELCQKVDHPHLTKTYDVGVQGDVHYIVMEYIPGSNLYRLVSEQGPLAVGRAARLFCEVTLGLEHAHGLGLIHRDLKPSNVMVTPDDRAKVLDLGLALMQGETGSDRTVVGGAGYVVGTLDYLAPEQAEDAVQVDFRTDIYSLGCSLYFTVAKQAPFPGGNALQKLLRHRCDEPTPLSEVNPDVAPEFAAVIGRMMAKKKEERFADAGEVRAALEPWCDRQVKAITMRISPVPAILPMNGPGEVVVAPPPPPAPFVAPTTDSLQLRSKPTPADPTPDMPLPAVVVEPATEGRPLTNSLPRGDVPFWLDFTLPVCASGLLLFALWLLGLWALLRR